MDTCLEVYSLKQRSLFQKTNASRHKEAALFLFGLVLSFLCPDIHQENYISETANINGKQV